MSPVVCLENFALKSGKDCQRKTCFVSGIDGVPDHMWLDIYGCNPTGEMRGDWAVVAILYPAMIMGRNICSEAPVDAELLYNLNGDVQSILCALNPALKRIVISAPICEHSDVRPVGSATGYSAGVDSYTTLEILHRPEVPEALRLTHFFLHNVGAMGGGAAAEQLFHKYLARLRSVGDEFGFTTVAVNSNIDGFYNLGPAKITHQMSHALRACAAVMGCGAEFGTYQYSSTYNYGAIGVSPDHDMSHTDPILLPLLSSDALKFVSTGASYSRFERSRLIANNKHAQNNLDVCVGSATARLGRDKPNCGRCWKCARELVTLDILGKLDDFSAVFDVPAYRRDPAYALSVVMDRNADVGDVSPYFSDVIDKVKVKWGGISPRAHYYFYRRRLARRVRRLRRS